MKNKKNVFHLQQTGVTAIAITIRNNNSNFYKPRSLKSIEVLSDFKLKPFFLDIELLCKCLVLPLRLQVEFNSTTMKAALRVRQNEFAKDNQKAMI